MSDGGKVEKPQQSKPPAAPRPQAPQTPGRAGGQGGYQAMMAERDEEMDKVTYRATEGAYGTPPAGDLAERARNIIGGAAQRISRKKDGSVTAGTQVPKTSGAPLPSDVRERMEPKLGADLSGVRVHTGGESAQAAAGFGAKAFTQGSDVHFNSGEFAPGSKEGDKLIAHELTHVVQGQKSGIQRKAEEGASDQPAAAADANASAPSGEGAEASPPEAGGEEHEVSHPDDPAEQEAEHVSEQVAEKLHAGGDDKKHGGAKDQKAGGGKADAKGGDKAGGPDKAGAEKADAKGGENAGGEKADAKGGDAAGGHKADAKGGDKAGGDKGDAKEGDKGGGDKAASPDQKAPAVALKAISISARPPLAILTAKKPAATKPAPTAAAGGTGAKKDDKKDELINVPTVGGVQFVPKGKNLEIHADGGPAAKALDTAATAAHIGAAKFADAGKLLREARDAALAASDALANLVAGTNQIKKTDEAKVKTQGELVGKLLADLPKSFKCTTLAEITAGGKLAPGVPVTLGYNPKKDKIDAFKTELERQRALQETGINNLTVDAWYSNADAYASKDEDAFNKIDHKGKEAVCKVVAERVASVEADLEGRVKYEEAAALVKALKDAETECKAKDTAANKKKVQAAQKALIGNEYVRNNYCGRGGDLQADFEAKHADGIGAALKQVEDEWKGIRGKVKEHHMVLHNPDAVAGGPTTFPEYDGVIPEPPKDPKKPPPEWQTYLDWLKNFIGASRVNSTLGAAWKKGVQTVRTGMDKNFPRANAAAYPVYKMNVSITTAPSER